MREIKFRAWDKQEKEMLLWNDWSDEIKDAIPHDAGDEWTERCIVMQFTGFHDKNGKEIYEGDIVRCLVGVEFHREVVFKDGNYYLINGENMIFPIQVVNTSHTESEVIGNIHENPEMMA